MNKFLLLMLIIFNSVVLAQNLPHNAKEVNPKIIFRPETQEEAFSFVMYLMKKKTWFKENRYNIALPAHEAFQTSLDLDEPYLKNIFKSEIYNIDDYEKSLEAFLETQEIVKKALEKLYPLKDNWDFKLMDKYEIRLTLYGPGGSYDWKKGHVISLISSDGVWRRARPIFQTIIHEMVHIGIEENIVKKYKLKHWEKERLVDLICSNYLKEILPNYIMQNITDKNIDNYVSEETIFRDLPLAIEEFVKDSPRD